MNYDITFCEGKVCPRRESCHRYRELMRYRADKGPNKKTHISILSHPDPDKCNLYWSENKL